MLVPEDIRAVQKRFDDEDKPLDGSWLDIEYSQDHKYFIWDKKAFTDHIEIVNDVAFGRKVSRFVIERVNVIDTNGVV